jgi:hypothetical protein
VLTTAEATSALCTAITVICIDSMGMALIRFAREHTAQSSLPLHSHMFAQQVEVERLEPAQF